jgi:hypothetical protein
MDATRFTSLPYRSAMFAALSLGVIASANAANPGGMEPWREYALRSLTPSYSWSDSTPAAAAAPSVLDVVRGRHFASVSMRFGGHGSAPRELSLSFDQAPVGAAGMPGSSDFAPVDFQSRSTSLHNDLMGASYSHNFERAGTFGVTALFAQQYYASPGLGLATGAQNSRVFDTQTSTWRETVTGQGVRMSFGSRQYGDWSWGLVAQSRIGVDAFQSVYGIYAEPGDFDLPARMSARLGWQALPSVALSFGVERVYYSQIRPFTSTAMPARLLSLMSSGGAPEFAWQDLTVYSVEGRMQDRWDGEWSLRVSSRQQPAPTESLYQQALEGEFASRSYAMGYQRGFGRIGRLSIEASHASSMAFLGAGSLYGNSASSRGSQTEVEVAWVVPF